MNFASCPPDLLIDGPANATRTIILAHGAGAAMDTEFMNIFAQGLAKHGLRVVRFEFSGRTQDQNWAEGVDMVARFVSG